MMIAGGRAFDLKRSAARDLLAHVNGGNFDTADLEGAPGRCSTLCPSRVIARRRAC
jgi:hypothetical protein